MLKNKMFLILCLLIAICLSISIISANQLNNIHDDNVLLKPLQVNNESLGTGTTHSELTVDFHGNQDKLYNDDECRITGFVEHPLCSMMGDPVHIYIDGKYVDTITMDYDIPSLNACYNDYKFHDLTPGEHTLTLKYDGYEYWPPLPDIEPCSYSCKIHVPNYVNTYTMRVSSDVNINVDDSTIINGTLFNNGKPVADARICVYINNKFTDDMRTDDEGHFNYTFTSEKSGNFEVLFKYVTPKEELVEDTCHVTVNDNYTIDVDHEVNMTVGDSAVINGTLLMNGKPVSDATILVDDGPDFIFIKTNADGIFNYHYNAKKPGLHKISFFYVKPDGFGIIDYCIATVSEVDNYTINVDYNGNMTICNQL